MTKNKFIFSSFFGILLLVCGQVVAGVAVIVSPDNKLKQLTQEDVQAIFMGKIDMLPDGLKVIPVNQPDDSNIFRTFNNTVLNKTNDEIKSYWAKQIFSGEKSPPVSYHGDKAVISYVIDTPGGIGYVDKASVNSSVKVLYKTD